MGGDQLFELRRRTFNTPHFRGIEFIEVEAKSILNHVPGNRMPFSWTINAYRGCSHACTFCLSGNTSILLADGTTKSLGDLRVGERIYGTDMHGTRVRVETEVLAHWANKKRAFRLTLEDGTTLSASGDHRFLTLEGWKSPDGGEHLDTEDSLVTVHDLSDGGGGGSHGAVGATTLATKVGLKIKSIEDLGIEMPMFDITTGTGDFIANGVVSHNCFARPTHTYLEMNAKEDFDSKIVVKVNAPELLPKELRKKSWKGESIAMGTNTDPYQRAEGKYKLTRQILEVLTEFRNPFSILTKGTLILRDLDLLQEAAKVTEVSTAFSIGTLDEDVWNSSEPGTPHPRKRIEAVAKLNAAGIRCGVLMAPILPGLSDGKEQLREVVKACIDAGAPYVSPIRLHLRPIVKDVYMDWLRDAYPELVPRYEEMYARSSYGDKKDREHLSTEVARLIEENGGLPERRYPRPKPQKAEPRAQQLSLL